MDAWLALRDARGRLWRGGAAKFFADGVIDAGTAWLEEPDTHGESTGSFWPDPQRLAASITSVRPRGLPGRDAHDRRRRRALRPGHLRQQARRPAPARAPRDAAGRSRRDDRRAAGVIASMQPVHLAACAATARQLERAARPRARRPRLPDARPARRRRAAHAGQRLAGRRRRPAARSRRRAAAAAAVRRSTPSCPSRR